MSGGSLQLRIYLRARRAGASREEACALTGPTGIDDAEAAGWDKQEAAGKLDWVDTSEPVSAASTEIPVAGVATSSSWKGNHMPKHDNPSEQTADYDPLVELASDTLRGDIRDRLLDWFKGQPKNWQFMSEAEQRDLAEAVDAFSYGIVKKTAKLIAAGERPTIVAKLVEYKEKDGIEAKLKIQPSGDTVMRLHEACGQDVLIVATGEEAFSGEAGPAAIDPDQRKMRGIGDEYEEAE